MAQTIRFTKTAIEAIQPAATGKRDEYIDDRIDALRLRVSATGAKSFCVLKRLKNRKLERVTLGSFPEMTVEQARRKATEVLAEIAGGANPAELKRVARGELKFDDLFDKYMERHARLRKRTADEDEQRYRQYLQKPLGNKRLSQITLPMLRQLLDRITASGHPVVANRVKALLSSVFNRGIEWGLATENPAKGIRGNRETSRDRFLTSEETERFLTALENSPEDIRDYVLLSLLTGARRSNVLAMRWADLDRQRGVWTVRAEESKNGTALHIPLVTQALEILERRSSQKEEGAEYVFPGTGKTGHLVEPKKAWYALLERANIQDFHLHDLRRTLGSWQVMAGASLAVVGKTLGHKNTQTTQVYARFELDPVRQAMELATQRLRQNIDTTDETDRLPAATETDAEANPR